MRGRHRGIARKALPDVDEIVFPKALVNAYVVRADVPALIDTGTAGATKKVLGALEMAGL